MEPASRAGVSTVTVHLKLNHSSTAALVEVTARLQQVRSELPPSAAQHQPPDPRAIPDEVGPEELTLAGARA